jgi:hypothetical protein
LETNSYCLLADKPDPAVSLLFCRRSSGSVLQRLVDERSMALLARARQRFEDEVK